MEQFREWNASQPASKHVTFLVGCPGGVVPEYKDQQKQFHHKTLFFLFLGATAKTLAVRLGAAKTATRCNVR